MRADPELWQDIIFGPKMTHLPSIIFFFTIDKVLMHLLAPLIVETFKIFLQLIHYSYSYSYDNTLLLGAKLTQLL